MNKIIRIFLTDKYRVNVTNTTQCQIRNAQCERIDNYCICHCFPEFIMVNGYCLKGKVTFVEHLKLVHIEDCHYVVWEFKEVCFTLGRLHYV